jgi:hypothetical protein
MRGMGLIFVPLLPFILSNVHSDDARSASGVANAVQQVGGALGIAVVGEVFLSQLGGFGVWTAAARRRTAAVQAGTAATSSLSCPSCPSWPCISPRFLTRTGQRYVDRAASTYH